MPSQVSQSGGIINPYGAGDVKLDSSPVTRYYLANEARKQAKDEALDNYFTNIQRSITPAGMRNQEVGKLVEMQKADQDYFLKNRQAIKNPALDGGKARQEYFGRHQDKLSLIQQSKNELAGTAQLNKLRTNPEIASRMDDNTISAIDIANLPIGDPRRTTGFNDLLENIQFSAKKLKPQEQLVLQNNYLKSAGTPSTERVVVGIDPNDKSKDIVQYKKSYAPNQLKAIGDLAASTHRTSAEVRETFKDADPADFEAADVLAKKVYGDDYVIDDAAKLYGALSMLHATSQSEAPKSEVNKSRADAASLAKAKALMAERDEYAKKKEQRAVSIKKGSYNQWLDSEIDDLEKAAESNSANRKELKIGGETKDAYVILNPTTAVLKQFAVDGVTPDNIVKYKNGEYQPVFYERESNVLPDGKTANPNAFKVKIKNGEKVLDLSIPATRQSKSQFKAGYGKAFASGNPLTQQFGGEQVDDGSTQETEKVRTEVIIPKGKIR
jgi:hypothetical protein